MRVGLPRPTRSHDERYVRFPLSDNSVATCCASSRRLAAAAASSTRKISTGCSISLPCVADPFDGRFGPDEKLLGAVSEETHRGRRAASHLIRFPAAAGLLALVLLTML